MPVSCTPASTALLRFQNFLVGIYTAKRLLRGLVTVWLVTLVVFMLLRITGDPVDFLTNPQMGAEDRAQMKKDFGLDAPWYVQYGKFNKEIFQETLAFQYSALVIVPLRCSRRGSRPHYNWWGPPSSLPWSWP